MSAAASKAEAQEAEAPEATQAAPVRSTKKRLVFIGALLAVAFAVALAGRLLKPQPPLAPLVPVGQVPAFALTDQRGAPFTNASLDGKAWVADFVFTTCTQTCPRLTARMKQLEDTLATKRAGKDLGVRFVSFSVDPETDTPAVLAAYAARAGADASWSFVTGPTDDVQRVVVQGFKITAQRIDKGAAVHDVLHGNWFVIGDGAGRIRGYYSTESDAEMDVIARDVLRLVAESGS